MSKLNVCQSCPQLIEEDEIYCLKCSMFDTIEADSTDKYLDELLVDDIINEIGSDGIEGVTVKGVD